MMKKSLSIIIPVYKVEEFIKNCLESVYAQDVPIDSYEVIVVNDGTPDNSMNIVLEFANKYENLRIINQENRGLSVARNNGLNVALGEYVWFVDSDDWIKENCLKKIMDLIDDHQTDVLSMPLLYFYEQKGKINKEDFYASKIQIISGKEYLFNKFPYGASQRYILKRAFLSKNNLNFYPDLLHEDGVFGPKILYMAKQVCVLNQSFYNYRIRSLGSIMSSWKKKNSEDLVFGYKILELFVNNLNIKEPDKSKFNSVIIDNLLASIIFARTKWGTQDFLAFYSQNRSFIAQKGLDMLRDKNIGIKYRIKGLIIYISPLLSCLIIILYSKNSKR